MSRAKQRQRRHQTVTHRPAALRLVPAPLNDVSPEAEPDADPLLDRIRQQWQQGDWPALADTPLSDIEHHPQRARLALLLAAGHQQLGQVDGARRCAQQALAWGCDRRSVAQVLISGVHTTLARAAALGDDAPRSRRHLEAAIGLAYPNQDVQALLAQRQKQLLQHPPRNATPAQTMPDAQDDDTPDTGEAAATGATPAAPLPPGAYTQINRVMSLLRKTHAEVAGLRQHVEQLAQRQTQNQVRWTEAYLRISRRLDGLPDLPSFQGWAVSADLGAWLMDRVEQGDYDGIVEFGSGSSTLLLALAALRRDAQVKAGVAAAAAPRHLALEHLPEHAAHTGALLARHAPGHAVQLVLSPLTPHPLSDGSSVPYYDAEASMRALAVALPAAPRLLVLVDGPPASGGPQARVPALALLLKHFPLASVECVVDDHARPAEQAMVQQWLARLASEGRPHRVEPLGFVKQAALLHWAAPAGSTLPT